MGTETPERRGPSRDAKNPWGSLQGSQKSESTRRPLGVWRALGLDSGTASDVPVPRMLSFDELMGGWSPRGDSVLRQ